MSIWQDMQNDLDELAAADLLRDPAVMESPCAPRVMVGGRKIVCLCSNDYLGLADDPAVKAAAMAAIEKFGVGSGASRLISGSSALHVDLERALARFKGAQAALVTATGWMANHVALHAFAKAGDLILCDKLNHASILDAALSSGARVRTYGHCDTARLEMLLTRHRKEHRRCLIVTDSLFSMDGDVAPLREIAQLKARFDAQLLIDEAHATGVLGMGGRGAAELLGVEEQVDAVVGTLSKALGAMGGFVAGPAVLIETIRNTGRPYIYTTALPPAICAAAIESLRIVQTEPARRDRLRDLAVHLHKLLHAAGLACGADQNGDDLVTQIQPILLGEAGRALRVSRQLLAEGFLVPAIRPPTVPRGTSRLRVSLSAAHDIADLERFVAALAKLVQA